MRVDLRPNRAIDDVYLEKVNVAITRTGKAQYALHITGAVRLAARIWTTRKDLIRVQAREVRPSWAELDVGTSSELIRLNAEDCDVHIESLDRNALFLGLYREGHECGLIMSAHGYIRTDIVQDILPAAES